MTDLILREWDGKRIRIREDRYVCLTDIAKASKKDFKAWYRTDSAKSYLATLSVEIGMQVSQIIQFVTTGRNENRGTWGHPEIVPRFSQWCSNPAKKKNPEQEIQAILSAEIGGEIEVLTPAGRIDLLTRSEIIEIKEAGSWKSAIGQLLVYGHYYPSRKKRLHLFGRADGDMKTLIQKHCDEMGITVTWAGSARVDASVKCQRSVIDSDQLTLFEVETKCLPKTNE